MNHKIIILLFLGIGFSKELMALSRGCGVYEMQGELVLKNGQAVVQYLTGTTNEESFWVSEETASRTFPYLGMPVWVKGEIKREKNAKWVIHLQKVTERIPDPVGLGGSDQMKLIGKPAACSN